MDCRKLRKIVSRVSEQSFNRVLPNDVPVRLDSRLSRAVAMESTFTDRNGCLAHALVFGTRMFRSGLPKVLIIDVIKHELCHLYLEPKHLRRAHGKVFRQLLKAVHGIYFLPVFLCHYQPTKRLSVYQADDGSLTYSNWCTKASYRTAWGATMTRIGSVSMKRYLDVFLREQYTKPRAKFPQIKPYSIESPVQMSLF